MIMAAKQRAKRKTPKRLTRAVANQTIADINTLLKTRKKLDLELKKLERNVKKLLSHQYFV